MRVSFVIYFVNPMTGRKNDGFEDDGDDEGISISSMTR